MNEEIDLCELEDGDKCMMRANNSGKWKKVIVVNRRAPMIIVQNMDENGDEDPECGQLEPVYRYARVRKLLPEVDPCQDTFHTHGDGSWWKNDGRGIPLCRVCPKCVGFKLSRYRQEVLEYYSQADCDDQIEPGY